MSEDVERKASKRQGRYIKGSSHLIKTISIEEFSFSKIADPDILYPDNGESNIIHARLHDPEKLEKGSKRHPTMHESLTPDKIGIIPPRNFTKEWNEQKKRSKNRSSKNSEEDDEYEEFAGVLQSNYDLEKFKEPEEKIQDPVKESLNINSDHSLEHQDSVLKIKKDISSESKIQDYQAKEALNQEELRASVLDDEERNKISKEAFDQGFREGLEKSTFDSEEKLKKLSEACSEDLNKALKEWKEERERVLGEYPSKIKDLVLALSESVIKEKISSQPEKFLDLIIRALNETLPQEDVSILVSEDWLQRLKTIASNPIMDKLKIDPSQKGLGFKIDGPRSSVTGNLYNILTALTQNIDWNELLHEEKPRE